MNDPHDGPLTTLERPSTFGAQPLDPGDPRVIEAVEAYLAELESGHMPDRHVFLAKHPEIAGVLTECLDALQFVHAVTPRLQPRSGEPAGGIEELQPATPLGDFQIVGEVGRGGMGVVYEATQLSLGRRVALKVLPFAAALDARQLQRFKNEAQAAAQLHHTNIVPVFGVGSDRGVHYYAMQYIEGQTLAILIKDMRRHAGLEEDVPLSVSPSAGSRSAQTVVAFTTERSDTNSSSYRSIAQLGIQAGEALQYAHQMNVVHRDIKPANLMVDAQGNLWVTDFGLAQVQTDTRLTLTGDLVGTLRYMSPEQALAHSVGVDHRTDVYSLGATLYELLTLEPAFNGRDRQELLRQIAFDEPKPLRRIKKAIPPELETIVLKAIAKNPAERYGTAQDLADDLRRFLEDQPIRARRPSLLERARKWTRRHRPVVGSAAFALLVTLVALAGSVGWILRDRAARRNKIAGDLQTLLQEAQRFQKDGNWPQAQAAAKRADALLQEETADPALAERVQGLLRDLAEEEADGRLVARLEELRLLQADVNKDSFVLERALPDYREAFADYGLQVTTVPPEEAARLLRSRPPAVRGILIAALDHWLILARYKKTPDADWLERVLALADSDDWRQRLRSARKSNDRQGMEQLAREVDATSQPAEELFLLHLGLRQRGAKEGAVALLRRAQEAFPSDFWINPDLGKALHDCQPPQNEEAIRFLTVAMALRPESAGARLNLGVVLLDQGRVDEAIMAFRKAIERKGDYAMAHNNLAISLARKNQLEEAVISFGRAIELRPNFADAHYNLGNTLWTMNRLDEALAAFRQVVVLKPNFADAHIRLGVIYWKKGRLDEAATAFRNVTRLTPDDAVAHYNLGNVLIELGLTDEAIDACRRAIAVKADYAEAHCNLGRALRQQGAFTEALAAFKHGHELGSRCPDWRYPSDEYVRACQRLIELDRRLPAVLQGEEQPGDASEQCEYAHICLCKKRYLAAARLWADAFIADPNLAADLTAGRRYDAACAAARAGADQGGDGHVADNERACWRQQAIQWLRAELAGYARLLEKGKPEDGRMVQQKLRRWQRDQDLAGLRDPEVVATLPADEHEGCKQLWAEVEVLIRTSDSAK
jgi:serine/threonine protein kinase/Flp pilus assembly protein TadD